MGVIYASELYHYGILGMKWGVRRYQNEDGTYTSAGKKRLKLERETEEYAGKQGGFKRFVKEDTFGGLMTKSQAYTYDMARSQGEGRLKSFARAKLDVNASDIAEHVGVRAAGTAAFLITSMGTTSALTAISATTATGLGATAAGAAFCATLPVALPVAAAVATAYAVDKAIAKRTKASGLSVQQRLLENKKN